jgi:hypothetical protein
MVRRGERDVGGQESQPFIVRHRVARRDREADKNRFNLPVIDPHAADALVERCLDWVLGKASMSCST